MDFSAEFQQTVANRTFPTYEQFDEALKSFTKITGSQFALKKKVWHRSGAAMRELHLYRYAMFKCICNFSTECEAFFNIASKGQCIRVTQFYMTHNHAVVFNPAFKQKGIDDNEGYDIRCDLSEEFEKLFPVKHFDTFAEFQDKLRQFQDNSGCIYVKRNADKYPPEMLDKQHLVYKGVKMECVHYGHRPDGRKPNQPNLRISCKIGCRSCIHISTCKGRVILGKYFMKHNHPVPIERAIQYPQSTNLAIADDTKYDVQYDVTTQFVEIFASGRFPTYKDFLVRLEEFQKETGCMYSKRMSNMWPADAEDKEHLVYKFVIFDCVHFGYTRSNTRRRQTERRAGFCFRGKVGCKSTMRLSSIKGYVEIVTYEMRHNHPASQEASDEYQPHTWLIPGIKIDDDDKMFRRRRRRKTVRTVEDDEEVFKLEITMSAKMDIITPQLDKLKEVALSADEKSFAIFAKQMSNFGKDWREKLNPCSSSSPQRYCPLSPSS